jgi:hypothetical protein
MSLDMNAKVASKPETVMQDGWELLFSVEKQEEI